MSKADKSKKRAKDLPVVNPTRELAKLISERINFRKADKNKRVSPVRSGADASHADIVGYISTGTSALDAATGGGFPCGRVSMVFGDPSSGKSLLSESAILSAQKRGGVGCIIDSEHTFNKARFTAKGGKIDEVLFLDADTLERGFEYVETTIKVLIADPKYMGKPIVVVWDTISTALTQNKLMGNEYASGMMEAPRVINDGFRKITEVIARSNTAFIILNQMYRTPGGDPVPPGGKGLQFFSSLILYLEKLDKYFSHRTGKMGMLLRADVMKNKGNPPVPDWVYFCCDSMGVADPMSVYYNLKPRGVGKKAVDPGVFNKGGSWLSYQLSDDDNDKVAWQGDKGFFIKSEQNPELVPALADELWKLWPPADPAVHEADSEFVQFHKDANPWVKEGVRYAQCLVSDHMCPIATWKSCRKLYWTECSYDLPDVETLERVYHDPPDFDADAAILAAEAADDYDEDE